MAQLDGKRVAVLATDYFEEKELTEPVRALSEAGATVEVIAPHTGTIQGLNHVEQGVSVQVDKTLDEVHADDYDALVIPGGAVNADHLRMEQKARDFVVRMLDELKRPTAVICHGPWLLVSSRLVRGRRLTSYYTLQDDIVNAGGEWTDEAVVTDGCLITSRNPDDLPAFTNAIIDAMQGPAKPLQAAM